MCTCGTIFYSCKKENTCSPRQMSTISSVLMWKLTVLSYKSQQNLCTTGQQDSCPKFTVRRRVKKLQREEQIQGLEEMEEEKRETFNQMKRNVYHTTQSLLLFYTECLIRTCNTKETKLKTPITNR